MHHYRKVSPRFWIHGSGKRLKGDPDAQVVAFYLMTGPEVTQIGLYHVALETIAARVGLSVQRTRQAIARIAQAGFAYFDPEAELAWVPNLLRFEVGDALRVGDKRRKGLERMAEAVIPHRFRTAFQKAYGPGSPFGLDLDLDEAPSEPLGSPFEGVSTFEQQEQEQEQEQEPEQEDPDPDAPSARLPRGPSKAEQILKLSERYEPGLVNRLRQGWGLTRKTGVISDGPVLKALRVMEAFPVEVVERAAEIYLDRHADGSKPEAYFLAIVKGEAKPPLGNKAPVKRGMTPPSTPEAIEESKRELALLEWNQHADF